ncbi:MAG: dual specificity protein phosphatase family protein [Thermogutta sp.]|uniref:dual specificity protein phosphatase family protein n=1 Tax=Thermogutta sp. TaxID=1962930 RepID=UPI001997D0FA|nr:dual specificity protein phosphatase family protein [Thermogutta sp.]MBC7352175.1 dual specificity protein phosphatase family protein [Thermogutta sp.]
MVIDQILDHLFVGSCPVDYNDVESLKRAGVTAVLNLQTDEDIASRDIQRSAVEMAYRRAGIKEVREPIRDFDYDHLRARLPEVVRALRELLQSGHKVFVHCTAGMNRSPTVVIAYLHWVLGWDLYQAESHVYARHYCYPLTAAIASQPVPTFDENPSDPARESS